MLREAAGLTGEDVGEELGWSVSKLSRTEKARAAVPWNDVSDLLNIYGVNDETRTALIQLCKDLKPQAWRQPYNDVLASFKNLANYIDLESAASSLPIHTPLTILGLLQTEDYARAIVSATWPLELTDLEVQRRVELRMQRQEVIGLDSPLRLWAILDEASMHREVGGPDVVRGQLQQLSRVAHRPEVTIQVIPFNAGGHVSWPGRSASSPLTTIQTCSPSRRSPARSPWTARRTSALQASALTIYARRLTRQSTRETDPRDSAEVRLAGEDVDGLVYLCSVAQEQPCRSAMRGEHNGLLDHLTAVIGLSDRRSPGPGEEDGSPSDRARP
ncbi:helix-turn-helix domain-containing protein [Actinoallomurus iriomotensis]|uniref:DUF5753 domain-containing protein n=1 Tax=Actinoallomurus iriomotensis TaxID=478107 RepID=A0A9W6RJE5_9ACTN|nr:helix-turn-helix transcriptional regulator [Actinoallomurus iriomotensis]GLY76798.1 hypothetical protein Airi01_050650 [Actinoallomurus iriomotensis]